MNIGARIGCWAGGGWKNPYVADGLVAMWDGEWNAGGGVHDVSATKWKDLCGLYDLNLGAAGSWLENCLYCDGTTAAAYNVNAEFSISSMTREVVFEWTEAASEMFQLVSTPSISTVHGTCSGLQLSSGGVTYVNVWYYKNIGIGKHHIVSIGDNTKANSGYQLFDGVMVKVASLAGANNNGKSLAIGSRNANYGSANFQYPGKGKVYSLRIYNRTLTDDEIAANYAVDRARFGLT